MLTLLFNIFILTNTIFNNADTATLTTKKVITFGYQKFTEQLSNPDYIKPFTDYLSAELPEFEIKFLTLSDEQLLQIIPWGELDFIICNPYIFIYAENMANYSVISTISRKGPNKNIEHQAGVIFCKANRTDINDLEQLKGKSVSAPGKYFFSGWILPLYEFKVHGIDPYQDLSSLIFTGSHDAVVRSVLSDTTDAGCISAFYLQKFINDGIIQSKDIKILNPKDDRTITFPHSTDAYPESCCIVHNTVPEEVKKKVIIALIKISPDSIEAQCFDSAGWTTPQNYLGVKALISKLKLPPFDKAETETISYFLKQHPYLIASLLIIWTLLIISIISIISAYRNIKTNIKLESLLQQSKIAQKKLEESERRYRVLTEQFPGVVYICKNDENYTMFYITDGIFDLTGYSKEDLLTSRITYAQLIHPEDLDYVYNEINEKIAQRQTFHLFYRVLHHDGYFKWVEEIGTGVWDNDTFLYLQGYIFDIDEKKKREEKEKEKTNRVILEREIISYILTRPEVAEGNFNELARITTEEIGKKLKIPRVNIWLFNENATKLICIDHYEYSINIHSSGFVLTEEDFANEFKELKNTKYIDAHNALEDPRTCGYGKNYLIPLDIKSMLDVGIRVGGKNVGLICFEYTNNKHTWDDDEINFACQVADQLALAIINQEKRKIEQQRDLLIKTIESTDEGVIITDLEGIIIYANPAVTKISGIELNTIVKKHISTFFSEYFYQEKIIKKLNILKSGKVIRGEYELSRQEHIFYTVEYAISPLFSENGELFNLVITFRDITQELTILNDLKQSQKMESIGQLAGGVAHDLNNHLLVMMGYAELAERELPPDSPVLTYIKEIESSNQKASTLVRQLLAFARKQILKKMVININDIVKNILGMIQRLIQENVEITTLYDPSIPQIEADPNAIEVILMNLCTNANDAMPDGGKLIIETKSIYLSEEQTRGIPWADPGKYVLISVTDTGVGMDKDVLEHCFDPFFTTKDPGKGTGLGLSTVYGLVQQHRGIIHAYSEEHKGTTFKVYLPAVMDEIEIKKGDKEEESEVPLTGNETILLAEDDSAVRSVATRILEQAGYRVFSAENGEEALNIFFKHIQEIDLAILDVIMPVLGGKEVYNRIKNIKPQLPVILSTGYTENSIHTNFILDEGLNLLNKPFGRKDLLKMVRKTLDQKKS
ncbi:MAG TPA: PhnD/SsuA/transferrin family substrate-binding protein [Candidatus Hydrogenedens sp.]|nr:PhnD/SsuA/transferrin family substrate-binding protein [Candidatus Hydrogenedens sp.]HOL19301.1 PhnD/SsuA/transferrin family substrate-binding protein [Candidatus Hydrogenedens sp.]HPP59254.1 PhnD/SsuA/transferrin family substrate-binding protein [Candidatus Hydrogenedens sp.]